jgi:hypothetical protein
MVNILKLFFYLLQKYLVNYCLGTYRRREAEISAVAI